jgi:hypothetical protein
MLPARCIKEFHLDFFHYISRLGNEARSRKLAIAAFVANIGSRQPAAGSWQSLVAICATLAEFRKTSRPVMYSVTITSGTQLTCR